MIRKTPMGYGNPAEGILVAFPGMSVHPRKKNDEDSSNLKMTSTHKDCGDICSTIKPQTLHSNFQEEGQISEIGFSIETLFRPHDPGHGQSSNPYIEKNRGSIRVKLMKSREQKTRIIIVNRSHSN